MTHFISFALALVFAVGASGCGTAIRMAPRIGITGSDMGQLDKVAQDLQANYESEMDTLANDINGNARFNLANGTLLAAASVFKAPRDVLGFFGLTAGANLAASAMFSPAVQLAAYESGFEALACMREKANAPSIAAAATGSSRFVAKLDGYRQMMARAQPSANSLVVSTQNPSTLGATAELELAKVAPLLASGDSTPVVAIYQMRLARLDDAVRKKVRAALKGQTATALRDDLISKVAEAQKNKDQAKASAYTLSVLNTGLAELAASFVPAAEVTNFDTDLKTCIANAGL